LLGWLGGQWFNPLTIRAIRSKIAVPLKAVQTAGRYGINYTISIARTSTEHFWIVVSTSWIVRVSFESPLGSKSSDQGAGKDGCHRKHRYIETISRGKAAGELNAPFERVRGTRRGNRN